MASTNEGGRVAKLKDKIQNMLDEGRMLVLGSQVLIGFQFRSAFEPNFEKLPQHAQYLKMCDLALMLVAFGLLLTPAAYHRIVEEGEDTEGLHRFASRVMLYALLPFGLALGFDIYVASEPTTGRLLAVVAGTSAGLVAFFYWYGLELLRRPRRQPEIEKEKAMDEKENERAEAEGAKLTDKIRHVLTEARVVLPGAQALLGFQFVTTLMPSFEKLPLSLRYVHLLSLLLVALSIVLLMTPAAYHRIVEEGEETEHFHRFASRILIAAMVPLALGVTGDFYVVLRKVTESATTSAIAAALLLLFFYGFWFAFTLYRRNRRQRSPEIAARKRQPLAS
jgi:cytochrome bd-type quinol oxidase subunit 2